MCISQMVMDKPVHLILVSYIADIRIIPLHHMICCIHSLIFMRIEEVFLPGLKVNQLFSLSSLFHPANSKGFTS